MIYEIEKKREERRNRTEANREEKKREDDGRKERTREDENKSKREEEKKEEKRRIVGGKGITTANTLPYFFAALPLSPFSSTENIFPIASPTVSPSSSFRRGRQRDFPFAESKAAEKPSTSVVVAVLLDPKTNG